MYMDVVAIRSSFTLYHTGAAPVTLIPATAKRSSNTGTAPHWLKPLALHTALSLVPLMPAVWSVQHLAPNIYLALNFFPSISRLDIFISASYPVISVNIFASEMHNRIFNLRNITRKYVQHFTQILPTNISVSICYYLWE